MKTKNLFSRFSAAALLAAALIPAALSSCSSDSEPAPTPDPIPAPEGYATLNLSITAPQVQIGTRVEEEPVTSGIVNGEGKLNDLNVIFYRESNGSYVFHKGIYISSTTESNIDGKTNNGTMIKPANIYDTDGNELVTGENHGDGYQDVVKNYPLPSGKYHVYVIANAPTNDYKATSTKFTSDWKEDEAAFRKAVYSLNATQMVNQVGPQDKITNALTMAADRTDISLPTGTTGATIASDGTLNVTSGSITLLADLTFQVAKVRLTLLFDNTAPGTTKKETDQSGNEQTVTVPTGHSYPLSKFELMSSNHQLINTPSNAFFFDNTDYTVSYGNPSASPKTITKPAFVVYPDNDWITGVDGTQANLATTGANSGTTGQIAFQTIFYLPENLATALDNKTLVKIPVKLDGVERSEPYNIYLPNATTGSNDVKNVLKRGHFYDVIAKVTSEGFAIEVKIKEWKKEKLPNQAL